MTREEAIVDLERSIKNGFTIWEDTARMAIKALKKDVYCPMAGRECFAHGEEVAWCLSCPHISEEERGLVKDAVTATHDNCTETHECVRETRGDLIRREDALRPFCIAPDGSVIPEVDCDNFDIEFSVKFIKKHLRSLPSVDAEPEWIPVSERLPENIRPVLVTWKNNDPQSYYQYIVGKHFIGTAHYHKGKWHWYSSVTEDLLAEYGKCETEEFDEAIEVVAWMPLPEPYREDGEV